MNQEHIDRFEIYCGKCDRADDTYILSKSRHMGIKRHIDKEDVISFGILKLKHRPRTRFIRVGNMCVDTKFLLTSMKVLHRRKYLSLGLLKMPHGLVFILKEGNNNICIAPAFVNMPPSPSESIESIIDLVEPSSGILMEWICYSNVFGGKKDGN